MNRLLALLLLVPALAQAELSLIRNATVHTADSVGTLEHTDVLLRNGKIAALGRGLPLPATATVIDAEGRPLTPGLFGGFTALGLEEISLEPSTVDVGHTPAAEAALLAAPRPEFDITPAFNTESAVVVVNRVEGLSFAMIAPAALPGGTVFAGLATVARLDGRPQPFEAASRSLLIDLGSDTAALAGNSRAAQFMLLEQAARETRPNALQAGDPRLLTATGREVLARHLDGGRIVFQVDRAADIRQVLAFADRHGARALILGGAEAWREAAALAAAQVPVLLDGLANLPASFDELGARLDNAARLHAAGVAIAFTQRDDTTHNARKVRQAAGNAVAHGLPWDAALAALTREPARMFGLADRFGRIAVGLEADLVLWSGDPLEVTSVAERMWIGGRPQSMRSRQSELSERYRPRPQAER